MLEPWAYTAATTPITAVVAEFFNAEFGLQLYWPFVADRAYASIFAVKVQFHIGDQLPMTWELKVSWRSEFHFC